MARCAPAFLAIMCVSVFFPGVAGMRYSAVHDADECNCKCCTVELRRPAEIRNNTRTKCSALLEGDERAKAMKCKPECGIVNSDTIFTGSARALGYQLLELERFCFYHCQPTSELAPLQKVEDSSELGAPIVDSECTSYSREKRRLAYADDGNGADPEDAGKMDAQ